MPDGSAFAPQHLSAPPIAEIMTDIPGAPKDESGGGVKVLVYPDGTRYSEQGGVKTLEIEGKKIIENTDGSKRIEENGIVTKIDPDGHATTTRTGLLGFAAGVLGVVAAGAVAHDGVAEKLLAADADRKGAFKAEPLGGGMVEHLLLHAVEATLLAGTEAKAAAPKASGLALGAPKAKV
jgi:hypothetical protein